MARAARRARFVLPAQAIQPIQTDMFMMSV